jgi:tryptophan 2,3-dioxygenase
MMENSGAFNEEELKKGIEYLNRLKEKYDVIGQDFFDYLEGLVQSNGIAYWDYIHLNSLLGLQAPRTDHPDELIFIMYHQVTELYFKMIKHELQQLTDPELKECEQADKWKLRIGRAVNYFEILSSSFDVMYSGMEADQFRQFRMALLPASGFQSVQFRHIEIMSTNLTSLLQSSYREHGDWPLEKLYPYMYWKKGGIDQHSGKKTLTLRQFEAKYDQHLQQFIKDFRFRNLNYLLYRAAKSIKEDPEVVELLRSYDRYVNVFWRLSHLSSASRYLVQSEEGTGGTNWRKYLPPKFQRVWFFESLWSEQEREEWGKAAVLRLFDERVKNRWQKIRDPRS